jgi:glutathione S-transferase
MKLYLNKTSPYARLALVTAHEAGLADNLETVWTEPWDDPAALLDANPLGKVPALVTDAGTTLIESGVICDHLVAVSDAARLMPRDPRGREDTLRRLGLGRATIDCSFGVVIHRRFSGGSDTGLTERWVRAIPRAVAALEKLAARRVGVDPDLGDIAVAVALDYVDFRLSSIAWRNSAPNLARWVDANRARSSFRATDPR